MGLVNGSRETEDPEWKTDGKITFHRDLPPGDYRTAEQKHYDLPYSFFEERQKLRSSYFTDEVERDNSSKRGLEPKLTD